ncbi:galactose oxidase [Gigaspora margarita]|uniref:Galactose oxidase n=1 Tax=Gigaspora margarita TaxID=4874 RepID=A0A8H4EP20_GIGMA|nr:galactose oxidase [Gigaspora margarita]
MYRVAQTSSLVNNKLYFFGGLSGDTFTNETWYLDLSNSFNVSMPPWHKGQETLVAVGFASSCVSPIDNSSVFLIGGNMLLANNASAPFYPSEVYKFDSKNSYWRPVNVIGYNNSFTSRYIMQAIIDNDGKIFIFGGRNTDINISDINITTSAWYNDMHMLDITSLKWSTLNISQNVPLPCIAYAAVLLPTDEIIYIGGVELLLLGNPRLVDIKMVRLFNTKSFTWSTKQITGASIDSRGGHTAVLTQNGSIIIYGGSTINYTQVAPDLMVLDINNWEWSIPNIPQTNAPQLLTHHSAAIYENYMIVSFGRIVSQLSPATINGINILDIRNYTWVAVATINNLESTPVPTVLTPTLNIVVTSVASIIIIGSVIAGIFIYKKRQVRRHSIATPGSK